MELLAKRDLLLLLSAPSNITQVTDSFERCRELPTGRLFWTVFSVVLVVMGVPASVMVLRELCQRRHQGLFGDVFMLNLSIMDFSFMIWLLPAVCNYMIIGNRNVFYFSSFIHCLPLCGRPVFMACICGDCYFAVIHPIKYMTNRNRNRIREAICLAVWVVTLAYGSVLCMIREIFTSPVISAPLMVALPVITFCDVLVFRVLKLPDPSGKINVHPKKKRALQTICTSFIMTFTAYLPPAVMFLFGRFIILSELELFCTFAFFGVSFCTAGCVIMPLLFLDNVGKLDHLNVRLKKCISS